MEQNYIIKSERGKRLHFLHFSLELLIGLIVVTLIGFGVVFIDCANSPYDKLQMDHHDKTTRYLCDLEQCDDHYDGYTTIENGQCTIHKQKAKIIREGYWDEGDEYVWVDPVIEHEWITEPCKHEVHNYKSRYDYAFKSIKRGSTPIWSDVDNGHISYSEYIEDVFYIIPIVVYLLFAIYVIIKHLKNRKHEIVVTASGILGKHSFGKKITIPAYNIKSASKKGKHKVIIETEDETKKFKFIKNSDEIIDAINNLDKSIPENFVNAGDGLLTNSTTLPKGLETYKELFASGIISEQEYLEKIKEYNEQHKEN